MGVGVSEWSPEGQFLTAALPSPRPDPGGGRVPAWPGPGWPACFLITIAFRCFIYMSLCVVGRSPREIASCGRERDS